MLGETGGVCPPRPAHAHIPKNATCLSVTCQQVRTERWGQHRSQQPFRTAPRKESPLPFTVIVPVVCGTPTSVTG